jgi:alkanesulfonate monooxygenase SsuD/methylene tetrahydromethanopterin reductase-like flavin-dependent oxidoreductase (luciferase family)
VSTLDHLTEGRFIFGVGVGGEFHKEFEACGVPVAERGARLDESIAVMRKLWSGKPATHDGRFFSFEGVTMQPPPRQAGGPPIWCGGRSDAALRRIGRTTDGWMSYVITPEMFRQGLEKIATAAAGSGRVFDHGFGTSHLLFTRLDDTYDRALDAATVSLSQRYGMDFRKAAQRYCALGPPQRVVKTIMRFTTRVSVTSFSISSVRMRSATVRSNASRRRRCPCWPRSVGDRRRTGRSKQNQAQGTVALPARSGSLTQEPGRAGEASWSNESTA